MPSWRCTSVNEAHDFLEVFWSQMSDFGIGICVWSTSRRCRVWSSPSVSVSILWIQHLHNFSLQMQLSYLYMLTALGTEAARSCVRRLALKLLFMHWRLYRLPLGEKLKRARPLHTLLLHHSAVLLMYKPSAYDCLLHQLNNEAHAVTINVKSRLSSILSSGSSLATIITFVYKRYLSPSPFRCLATCSTEIPQFTEQRP